MAIVQPPAPSSIDALPVLKCSSRQRANRAMTAHRSGTLALEQNRLSLRLSHTAGRMGVFIYNQYGPAGVSFLESVWVLQPFAV